MAAVTKINISTSTGPTNADAEATGIVYSREDTPTGTTPIPKPSTAGTNFSWYKNLYLNVVSGGGTTSISNRKLSLASSPATGLGLFFKDGTNTYTQAASGNKPTDDGAADGATPSTYTALTTTPQTYDAASAAATNSTRNGNYAKVVLGVSSTYAGGAGAAITLPNLTLTYDEA